MPALFSFFNCGILTVLVSTLFLTIGLLNTLSFTSSDLSSPRSALVHLTPPVLFTPPVQSNLFTSPLFIFIKETSNGIITAASISPYDTIGDTIFDKTGIPIEYQSLKYNGKVLECSSTYSVFSGCKEATVEVFIRHVAGVPPAAKVSTFVECFNETCLCF
jgi:hypothetical protein